MSHYTRSSKWFVWVMLKVIKLFFDEHFFFCFFGICNFCETMSLCTENVTLSGDAGTHGKGSLWYNSCLWSWYQQVPSSGCSSTEYFFHLHLTLAWPLLVVDSHAALASIGHNYWLPSPSSQHPCQATSSLFYKHLRNRGGATLVLSFQRPVCHTAGPLNCCCFPTLSLLAEQRLWLHGRFFCWAPFLWRGCL